MWYLHQLLVADSSMVPAALLAFLILHSFPFYTQHCQSVVTCRFNWPRIWLTPSLLLAMQQTATHWVPAGLAEVETSTPMLLCWKLIWKLIKLIKDCYNTLSPSNKRLNLRPHNINMPLPICLVQRLTHYTSTHPVTDLNSSPIPGGIPHTYAQVFVGNAVGRGNCIFTSSASPAAGVTTHLKMV
jgi:hypothetical protein